MGDRKLDLREIPGTLKISEGRVFTILHESLGMGKLFLKWVSRLVTPNQKQQRFNDSERCLELFKRGKKNFLHRYVTMDETWIHHYTPETKRSLAECTAASESPPKRPKTQQCAGKVMASVFWDAHGILFIDYHEKFKTIYSISDVEYLTFDGGQYGIGNQIEFFRTPLLWVWPSWFGNVLQYIAKPVAFFVRH